MEISISTVLIFLSCVAVAVSLVVEGLKSFGKLSVVPTKLIVYLTSVVLTPTCFICCMAYLHRPIEWFMVFASFLASFVVAKVSMGGWDDITELVKRCMKKEL